MKAEMKLYEVVVEMKKRFYVIADSNFDATNQAEQIAMEGEESEKVEIINMRVVVS